MYAAARGDKARLLELLKKGADVNGRDVASRTTALHWAARECQVGSMKILLGSGANVNARDWLGGTPLHDVLPEPERVCLLIAAGAGVNAVTSEFGNKPFYTWADHAVDLLLNAGANVNVSDVHGRTPIMVAAEESNIRMIGPRGIRFGFRREPSDYRRGGGLDRAPLLMDERREYGVRDRAD